MQDVMKPLGMKDKFITDKQITASSIYKTWSLNSFSWYSYFPRLGQQGKFNAWTAERNPASECCRSTSALRNK